MLIGFFVLGSVGLVLWMGARRNIPNSMTGVLSAGVGVCGVSAAVAAAPVVQAKSTEIAYTIGTILLLGVLCMFIFPIVGKAMGMGSDPVRRLGRHRHPELRAGRGRGARLPAERHRDPEGRRDLQHHARAVPADHRAVAGGVVREARADRRAEGRPRRR